MKACVSLFLAVTSGCTLLGAGSPSAALVESIKEQGKTAYGQPPEAIYSYTYKGKTVFLSVPPCCDHLAVLYDEGGKPICSPRGGFTGKGDGTCPDFEAEKKDEKQVFKLKKAPGG